MTRPYNGEKRGHSQDTAFGFLSLPNHMRECLHGTPKVKVSSFQLLYTHYYSPLSTSMSKPITLLKYNHFLDQKMKPFTLHLFSSTVSANQGSLLYELDTIHLWHFHFSRILQSRLPTIFPF